MVNPSRGMLGVFHSLGSGHGALLQYWGFLSLPRLHQETFFGNGIQFKLDLFRASKNIRSLQIPMHNYGQLSSALPASSVSEVPFLVSKSWLQNLFLSSGANYISFKPCHLFSILTSKNQTSSSPFSIMGLSYSGDLSDLALCQSHPTRQRLDHWDFVFHQCQLQPRINIRVLGNASLVATSSFGLFLILEALYFFFNVK